MLGLPRYNDIVSSSTAIVISGLHCINYLRQNNNNNIKCASGDDLILYWRFKNRLQSTNWVRYRSGYEVSWADDALKGRFPRLILQASQPTHAYWTLLTLFDYFWERKSSCIFINFECLFTRSFRVLLSTSFVSIPLPPYKHERNAK